MLYRFLCLVIKLSLTRFKITYKAYIYELKEPEKCTLVELHAFIHSNFAPSVL